MFRARTPLAVAALVCSLGLSLSGCSSPAGEEEAQPAPSSAPAEPTQTPAEPSEQATESPDDSSTDGGASPESTGEESPGGDGSGGDDAAGKPSKEDVVEGYVALIEDQVGSSIPEIPGVDTDEVITETARCLVDEVYDDASVQTLEALAASDASGIDPADAQLFTDAQGTCQQEVAERIQEQVGG